MATQVIAAHSGLATTIVASSSPHCKLASSSTIVVRFSQSLNLKGKLAKSSKPVKAAGQVRCCTSIDHFDQNEILKDAAKGGNLKVVDELLGGNVVNVDSPSANRAGWTALHLACFYGHNAVVQSLIKAGANIEVRNDSGNTPLQMACLKGNIDIARTLLDSGADLHAESLDKGTAFDYAQEWGGDEMVDFLTLWAASRA